VVVAGEGEVRERREDEKVADYVGQNCPSWTKLPNYN